VVAIVAERIALTDLERGFVLDGFPRTVSQAEALDEILRDGGLHLDAVIELSVDPDALLNRIKNRVQETQARGETVREDDNAEAFRTRWATYVQATAPLSAYYRARGLLHVIDGMRQPADVFQDIIARVK
jgi:adenylate kinase